MESFEIAQWADKHGQKDKLIPDGQLEIIRRCAAPVCHSTTCPIPVLHEFQRVHHNGAPCASQSLLVYTVCFRCYLHDIGRWNQAADDVLEYGRAKFMARLKTDKVGPV